MRLPNVIRFLIALYTGAATLRGMIREFGSGLFADSGLGCVGAILATLLVAGAVLGLVALAWWGR